MSKLFILPDQPALDTSGSLVSGAKLHFYETGTTTPADVYTTATLSTPHSNPVVADGAGRFAPIYLDPTVTYKVVLTDSGGTQIGSTVDPYPGLGGDFIYPESYGAPANGTGDDLAAFQAAIAAASDANLPVLLTADEYRLSTTFEINVPVTIMGLNRKVNVTVENSNVEEGFLIASSDVTLQNFTITAAASSPLINGTGHKGTCVTLSVFFTDPADPEPELVKNIIMREMNFHRKAGTKTGHAIAMVARTSGVLIENCDFVGAGDTAATGSHATAILTHWGAWSHGVSSQAIDYDAQTQAFDEGAIVSGSAGSGYIIADDNNGTTGTLYLKDVEGTFAGDEIITDSTGGSATANGTAYSELRQARFEPDHYSYHPNNLVVRNIRVRNTLRVINCSSSYSIDVDGVDYEGPAQGSSLIKIVAGDEADTFAHPDDFGRVYDAYSFKNMRGIRMNGIGSANTVIDISSLSTSKQSPADLAAYASAPYGSEAYAGVEQPKFRAAYHRMFAVDGMDYDNGDAPNAGGPVVVTNIEASNAFGNFIFRNINGRGRGAVLSADFTNMAGSIVVENCTLLGGVELDQVEHAHFVNSKIEHPEITSGSFAVFVSGDRTTVTKDAGTTAAGATELTFTSQINKRVLPGTPITYAGGVVYATQFANTGDTTIAVTPLPVDASGGASFVLEQSSRNISFDGCEIEGGNFGIHVEQAFGVTINGGRIRGAGQYGVLADTNSAIYVTGTLFSNNGIRLLDDSISTRDAIAGADSVLVIKNCRFENSHQIEYNIVANANAEKLVATDNVFAGLPLTGTINIAALSNGEPVIFHGNTDAVGNSIFLSGTWTPQLELGGQMTGMSLTVNGATYTVYDDRVLVDYDFVLSAKGSSAGSATISGLPFDVISAPPPIGSVMYSSGFSGLNTGAGVSRIISGKIGLYEQNATGVTTLKDTKITDTSRFIGSTIYRRQ